MVGRCGAVCAIVLAGCRFNFDPRVIDGGGDTAADTPPVLGCPSFALFCDDFEGGDLSRWTTTKLQGPAAATVSGTRVHGGSFALETKVDPAAADGGNAAPALMLPPQSTGVLAVRQWIALDATLRDFNIVVEMWNTATLEYVAVGGNNSANWVVTEDPGTGAVDHQTGVPTPGLDVWTCVEVVYAFTPPGAPRLELYVNDAMVFDDASTYTTPSFDEVRVGITRADMTGFSLFTDDVVIADQRIGCQ